MSTELSACRCAASINTAWQHLRTFNAASSRDDGFACQILAAEDWCAIEQAYGLSEPCSCRRFATLGSGWSCCQSRCQVYVRHKRLGLVQSPAQLAVGDMHRN